MKWYKNGLFEDTLEDVDHPVVVGLMLVFDIFQYFAKFLLPSLAFVLEQLQAGSHHNGGKVNGLI